VIRGAVVVNTRVPVRAPKAVESTTIEKVSASMTVAVVAIFTGVQLPVAPVIVIFGREEIGNPCPTEVKTTGLALVAAEMATLRDGRVPCVTTDRAVQR
jgi:hypothetical protein